MRFLIFVLLFVLHPRCSNNTNNFSIKRYSITVNELDMPRQFNIPLQHEGWCIVGLRVLENTADDSVRIGAYLVLPPGKTGMFYRHEQPGFKPFSYDYVPYKATKGKIVIEWSLKPD